MRYEETTNVHFETVEDLASSFSQPQLTCKVHMPDTPLLNLLMTY